MFNLDNLTFGSKMDKYIATRVGGDLQRVVLGTVHSPLRATTTCHPHPAHCPMLARRGGRPRQGVRSLVAFWLPTGWVPTPVAGSYKGINRRIRFPLERASVTSVVPSRVEVGGRSLCGSGCDPIADPRLDPVGEFLVRLGLRVRLCYAYYLR